MRLVSAYRQGTGLPTRLPSTHWLSTAPLLATNRVYPMLRVRTTLNLRIRFLLAWTGPINVRATTSLLGPIALSTPARSTWQIKGTLWTFIPRNLIPWCPWIGIVLVVLSTRINAQGYVGTMLTLRTLFTTLGSIEPAQGFPHFLACLQIGRLTC